MISNVSTHYRWIDTADDQISEILSIFPLRISQDLRENNPLRAIRGVSKIAFSNCRYGTSNSNSKLSHSDSLLPNFPAPEKNGPKRAET